MPKSRIRKKVRKKKQEARRQRDISAYLDKKKLQELDDMLGVLNEHEARYLAQEQQKEETHGG